VDAPEDEVDDAMGRLRDRGTTIGLRARIREKVAFVDRR